MINKNILSVILSITTILGTAVSCGKTKTPDDPLEILKKHCDAMGGLEKIKTQKSFRFEADFTMGDLKGTMIHRHLAPNQSRQELDLPGFKSISGDDGKAAWSVDQNGKVLIHKDDESIKRRKVQELLQNYAFMDPQSKHFTLTFQGTEKVGKTDCYVVKIANTINGDLAIKYIDTQTFLMEKSLDTLPYSEIHQVYSDYRDVGGIKQAFHREVTRQPENQTFTIHIRKFESNIPIDAELFKPPKRDVRDFRFTAHHRAENIPFEFIKKHIMLRVKIKGKESLWMLDTGAGMSVVDLEFAKSIGLIPEGKIKAQGVGKTLDVSLITVPSITLPGLEMAKQRIAAADFVAPLFRKAFGMNIPGLLGYDFMSRFVIKIDYADEKISFYDPDKFQYKGTGKILQAPLAGRNFVVPMTVTTNHGRYSGTWRVDMGAGGIDFHYPYAKEKGFLNRKGIDWVSYGAGGANKSRILRFKQLEFAGYTIKEPLIGFPLEANEGVFMDKFLVGNIGNSLFRHFVIYLDYKNQQMIVEKGKRFGHRFPVDRSGLQLMVSPKGEIKVTWTAPDTPGEDAGFKQGDILKAVNGTDIHSFGGVVAVRELFKKEIGTLYKVTVERAGERLALRLKLRDLYETQ